MGLAYYSKTMVRYYNLLIKIRVLNKRTTFGNIYLENRYIRTIRVKKVNVTSFIK